MKPPLRSLLLAASLVFHVQTHAMTVEVKNNQVFASGLIGGEDFRKFEAAFSKPEIDTVVLVNSLGGDLWTGLTISRLITSKGYKTVTAGYCISACSLMFMAGKERRFSNTFHSNISFVGIHGAHSMDTGSLVPSANTEMYALLKIQMGEKFNADIINTAFYKMQDFSGFLRVPENARSPNARTVFCPTFKLPLNNCITYDNATALNLGILTHEDLVTVDLPDGLKQVNTLFGRTLSEIIPDMQNYLKDIAQEKCISDGCKSKITDYENHPNHKALAIRVMAAGFGVAFDKPNTDIAALVAVYMCNHMSDRPIQLCDLTAADNFNFYPSLKLAKLNNLDAFKNIFTSHEKYYANENLGGSFFRMKNYSPRMSDIPPTEIEGVTTIGTQELSQRMQSATPPMLVDVGDLITSIPNAEKLMFGGLVFDNAETESAFNTRFTGLLAFLAPEPSQPLVIFSSTRDEFSANAALRAKRAGYTQVLWYRGGTEAWTAANLPTVLARLRAVAN